MKGNQEKKGWAAMNIVNIKLKDLKPYEKNPRKNDEAVKPVMESIKQFGFKVPIVVDRNNVIVAGHTRYKASKKLHLEEVPCIIADDLTDEQIKAFRLADNKVGEIAQWDLDLLAEELADIDMSMDVFGFEGFDLEDDSPEVDEDYYEPNPPKAQKTKRGDIFQLGDHFLMCGDCTQQEDVETLTQGLEMDLCVTDPPYNVDYVGKTPEALKMENDSMSDNKFHEFLQEFYTRMLETLKPGGSFYIWHAESEGVNFRTALQDAGGTIRQCLIWNKNTFVMGRQDYQWKHEPCLYGWKAVKLNG